MHETIERAFADELVKIGIPVGELFQHTVRSGAAAPLVIGGLAGGLSVYDLIKRRGIDGKVTVEDIRGTKPGAKKVDTAKYVEDLVKANPTKRKIVPVTTKKDVKKLVKDPSLNVLTRAALENASIQVIEKGTNAYMFPGKSKDYIIAPTRANPRVIEHEVGHAIDIAGQKPKFLDKIHRMLGTVWKPSFRKSTMEREERAWKHAKKTPLKGRALGSYEKGFHTGRSMISGAVAIASLVKGMERAMGRA